MLRPTWQTPRHTMCSGLLAYHDHRLGEADDSPARAIAHVPAQAEMHANHAAILRKLGRLADAETAARSALELEPDRVAAHNNLGNILRDASRYDESAACYRAAIRLDTDLRRCLGQSGVGPGIGGPCAAGGGSRPSGHRLRLRQMPMRTTISASR